ncbi:MAG: restriction endonuclease subunit S [Pseudomonas sp.]|uniref:restriction endonuclease subunit S n=1 Tax=Pseudomonas sp. FEMGT703P TaxID=2080764 RepID=UPI000CBA21A9|nr:restriction endonuclease subunit S [Pseudomonas sp. FEMGT703P]PJE41923.1 MAG: restriction endonuclease subunit S [Pseudomonas sp.] [Pseudomonas sp. FEMGT703P]
MSEVGRQGHQAHGEDWVPDGWLTLPLGSIASVRKTKGTAKSGVPCVELEHIESQTGRLLGWDASGTQTSIKTSFTKGDVLFGKLRPYLRKYAVAPFDGVCTTEVLAIYPNEEIIDSNFLFNLMQGDGVFSTVEALSYGTKMPRVSWADLSDIIVDIPPLSEQKKVAAILTAVDDKLDVIAGQIEATHTLKQGLMQTLFSQCSADWPTVSLQEVAGIRTGVAKGKKGLKEPIELPYLRVANVQDGHIDLTEVKTIAVDAAQVERYALQSGDVLMTEGGDFDKLGRGDVWEGQISPCLHQNHVFAVRPTPSKLNSYYLAALAASDYGRQYFLSCAKRTTNLASINSSQLKSFPVLLPPLDEQVRIADIVAAANARIETLSTKKAHYQTLKRGLMQKLLTGEWRVKLDSPSGIA